jgi:omega-amidase
MRAATFQFDTHWLDHKRNLSLVKDACTGITGMADLLVLHEMFNTGYVMHPAQDVKPKTQVETITTLRQLAIDYKLTIMGSIPMHTDDGWINAFLTINAQGIIGQYPKIHLFTPAGEKENYKPGQNISPVMIDGWKVLPLICYDLRFPYLTFGSYIPDCIVYTANWPEARVHHWQSLLCARAIECQCYVIGVNRTGTDKNGYSYPGSSMVIDYNGKIIHQSGDTKQLSLVNLDKEDMMSFREKLPFVSDRIR